MQKKIRYAAIGVLLFISQITLAQTCPGGAPQNQSNPALGFDGVSDQARALGNAAYELGTGDFTLEAFINTSASGIATILSRRSFVSGHASDGFLFSISGGKLLLQLNGTEGGTGNKVDTQGPTVNDGTCHHVAVRRSSGTIRFFVDGVITSTSHSETSNMNSDNGAAGILLMGVDRPASNPFSGTMDEVRIWNVARTDLQISGSSGFPLTGTETGLIGNWEMNEASGQTLIDNSPTANNGFLGTTTSVQANDPTRTNSSCFQLCCLFPADAGFGPVPSVVCVSDIVGPFKIKTGTLTHLWDFGDGSPTSTSTSPSHIYTTAGLFTITHIVTTSCDTDTVAHVIQIGPPDASFTSSGNVCNGDTIDFNTVDITASHLWDFGDGSPSSTAVNPTHAYSPLILTSFTVTHTATNVCGSSTSTEVLIIPASITANVSTTSISCNGGNDGSIDLTVSGGISPFTFLWSNGATTEDISGLGVGAFFVTITDFSGCELIVRGADTICATIQPDASTGKDAMVFSLSGRENDNFGTSSFFRAMTWTFSGVPGTIRSFLEFDLTSIPNSTTITGATLFLTSDSTGTFPFGHSTLSGSNNSVFNRVTAAWDESTITWNNQPLTTTLNQITVPATTSIDEDYAIDITDFAQDMITNPTTNYGMMWRLSTEVYYRQVLFGSSDNTDAFRRPRLVICLNDTNGIIISEPDILGLTNSIVDVSCAGACDGQATSIGTGGTPPYTYLWNDPLLQTTQTATGLCAGTYKNILIDANGCQLPTVFVTVTEPAVITSSIAGTNVMCNGGSDGSADLTVSGGTAPFIFAWSNGATTEDISGLSAGTFNVTVTDDNGCTGTGSVTITQPATMVTSIAGTNVSCNGGSDGSADLTVSGGTAPLTFAWSNGATTEDISGLSPGAFNVTVTDDNGCTGAGSVTITQPATMVTSIVGTNVTCQGGNDGSIDLTVSGGTAPFTFAWSNGATTEDISGLSTGTFNVTVTDNNGCTATDGVTITQPLGIFASIFPTNVTCNGGSDGSINLVVSGGTSPLTFAWSNGETTEDILGLSAGSFAVTVTDANGCTAVNKTTITEPPAITATLSHTNVTCIGGSDGSVDLTVSGGSAPITFAWSNGENTEDISGLSAGIFIVTITDANNCITQRKVKVLDGTISIPDASFGIAGDSCFRDTISFTSVFTSGTHFWDFGDGSATSTDVNPTHVYVSEGVFEVTHVATNICGPDTAKVNVTRQFCCVASPGCPNPTFTSILASDNNMYIGMDICERTLNVCADEQVFDFTIKHRDLISNDIDNLTFTIELPTGTSFGSFTVLESPGGSVTFDVPSLTFSLPSLPPDSLIRIQVTVIVNCSIVPFAQGGNPILVGAEANYEVSTVPFTLAGTDPESYNVENGDLVIIDVTNQFFLGNVGDTYVRKISVLNGGNGSLSAFDLTETFDPGISVDGALGSLVRTFTDIDFTNNPDSSSNGDCFFDRDEVLIICDTVVILNCDSAKTRMDATYGCDGDTCVENGDVAFANTLISNGGPNFRVTTTQYIKTNYCNPDTGTITYNYKNNGFEVDPGGARANDIRVVFRSTTAVSTLINFRLNTKPLDSIPGFSFNSHTSGAYRYYVLNFTNLTTDPDGPGGIADLDGDGFYDNLEKNSSFNVTADIVMVCPNEFAVECPATFYHEIVRTWIHTRDQCRQNFPRRYGRNYRTQGFRGWKPQTSGPTELGDQDTGTYCFKFDYRIRGLQNMSCNNFKPEGLVVLPPGFSAVPGSGAVGGSPTTFTQSNDTLFITGLPFGSSADHRRVYQQFCVDLILDCDDPNLTKISRIKFEQRYECDTTCSCAIRMGCTSIEVKNLCTCEDTLVTTIGFEAVRTTLGWTDPSRSTLISPTRTGIRLDRVYECDSIRTYAPGMVLTDTITNAQVTITNGVFGTEAILIPSNAFFIITDVSTSVTDTCPAGPPVIHSAGTNPDVFFYVYDATPCITANFGGMLNLGDSIKLVADFGIKKSNTIPAQNVSEFSCFTATHSSVRAGDTISCDSRGTRMYVLVVDIQTRLLSNSDYNSTSSFSSTCGQVRRTLRFRARGGLCGADDFPNEFRNRYRIGDTVEFILPVGYSYVPGSSRFRTQSEGTIAIEDPVITNGILTFRRQDNPSLVNGWPLQDKVNYTQSLLYFNVTPLCEAAEEPMFDTARFDWVNHHYAAEPSCFDSIFDVIRRATIHHLTPHIDIEPKLPFIAGINPVDTFCIRLCNDLQVAIDSSLLGLPEIPLIDTVLFEHYNAPNTWLVFNNPSGNLDILHVIDTTGGATDTLEIIGQNGDSILINVDSIALFDCRFILLLTSSKSCAPTDIDTVIVTGGWSCNPLDSISDIACLQDTGRLFLYPKESAMQASLIRPENNVFDACAPVTYELEIVNSRLPRIYDVMVQAQLPAGMTYVSNSSMFKYPLASSYVSIPESLITVSGDSISYNIDSLNAEIDSLGLEGVTNIARNKFRIRFDVTTDCNYTSGSIVEFEVSSLTNCDSLIVFSFTTDPQFLTGTLPEYTTNINATSDGFANCSNSTAVTFNILNNGPDATSPTDSLEILLPEGTSFITGSFVGIVNPPTHSAPNQSTVGGQTLLKWDLPDGVGLGAGIQFSIGIGVDSLLECGTLDLEVSTTFQDSTDCVSEVDSVCNITGISGNRTFEIDVEKPELDLAAFTASVGVGCSFTVVSVDVTNSGIDVPAGTTTQVDFYCDSDGSGGVSMGDNLMGSLSTTAGILNGNTVTLTDTLLALCDSSIIAVIDDGTNCVCTGAEIIVEPISDTVNVCCVDHLDSIAAIDVGCFGDSTGQATAVVAGGTPPYTFIWSNGGTTQTITGLATGTYGVTVTDANDCVESDTTDVGEPSALALNLSSSTFGCGSNVSCTGGSDGSVTANVSGGTPAFTFLWSDGQTTSTATGLAAGIHSVTVTDNNGCTTNDSIRLTEPAPLALTCSLPAPEPDSTRACDTTFHVTLGFGVQSIQLSSNVSGGCPPYTHSWSPAVGLNDPTSPNPVFTAPLTLGQVCVTYEYTLTVTDSNGCEIVCMPSNPSGIKVFDPTALAGCGNINNQKVVVCHIPPGNPGNPQIICISPNAVPTHVFDTPHCGHSLGIPCDCIGHCDSTYACTTINAKYAGDFVDDGKTSTEGAGIASSIEFKPETSNIAIYPNPTTGFLTVELYAHINARVMIYNAGGEVVGMLDSKELPMNKFEFDLSELVGGVYLVHIITDDQVVTRRVIYIK